MSTLNPIQLDSAVNALCPHIWNDMQSISVYDYSESLLWEELVCCILSSQVRFELSRAITQNIKRNGLLDYNMTYTSYEKQLSDVLKIPVVLADKLVKYRFPNTKAKQIAAARENIYGNGLSLHKILNQYSEPPVKRNLLIKLIPGIGMKQASMYLRNVATSFELAIIDSHVLRYMSVLGLAKNGSIINSMRKYLIKENILKKYANKFGYPVGCVDYAIWIVMRVALREGYL